MSDSRFVAIIMFGCVWLGGCAKSASGDRANASVRDSAGISVVTSFAPAWSQTTAWRIDSIPIFDVGGSETDTTRQFANVKGTHRMANGTVAVFDAGSSSIRFFDSLGAPVGRAGRRGRGPGELQVEMIRESAGCGSDSVYVPMQSRVLVFASPGKYVREFTLPPRRYFIACRGTGMVVAEGVSTWPTTAGLHPDTVAFSWVDLVGKPGAVIDTLPSWDRLFGEAGPEGRGYIPPPWGRRVVVAAGSRDVVTGDGGRFEVTYHDAQGRVRRIARVDSTAIPLQPVTQADIDRFKAFVRSKNRGSGEDLDSRWTRETVRPTAPAFAAMVIDADDNVWLREYDWADVVQFFDYGFAPGRGSYHTVKMEERGWNVLDAEGRLLGRMKLPSRFEVAEIGSDWVLGVWRNEDDVEHVRIYRIVKSRQ